MHHCFNNAIARSVGGVFLLMLTGALADAQVGSISFDVADHSLERVSAHVIAELMAPWGYAQLQVVQQAVEGTKGLDDAKPHV
jgi:hypothetical protein